MTDYSFAVICFMSRVCVCVCVCVCGGAWGIGACVITCSRYSCDFTGRSVTDLKEHA